MEGEIEAGVPSSAASAAPHKGGGWQALWFLLHLAVLYAIVQLATPWLAGWTHGKLLPFLLHHPMPSGRLEFLFSHILAFSFIPAFLAGLANARFRHKAAEFVWLVPAVVLAYKFLTFPSPTLFQSRFDVAFHQYFGGGFVIPEFRDWREFWSITESNPNVLRGMAQLQFTAPFYAGIGYSFAAWIGRRTEISRRVAESVKTTKNQDLGLKVAKRKPYPPSCKS